MSRYRDTLNRWASQHVPDGATVADVVFEYDDGYDPTFTDRSESLSVTVYYRLPGKDALNVAYADQTNLLSSLGEMLTELFAIEEADDDSTA